MGLLGEQYKGRIVIGWSGHKSESTIKQYIHQIPAKKREISNYLGSNIKPKVAKVDGEKYVFKAMSATVSKPPDIVTNEPATALPPPVNVLDNPPIPEGENQVNNTEEAPPLPLQYDLQALEDGLSDDQLMKVLEDIKKKNENLQPSPLGAQAVSAQNALMPNNTMNIQQNVSNVQNVHGLKSAMVPTMYFGGHSNVTINCNFNSPK